MYDVKKEGSDSYLGSQSPCMTSAKVVWALPLSGIALRR